MLAAGQTLSLTIEKPAVGGPMIARADGRIVLVEGAIRGERVRARLHVRGATAGFFREGTHAICDARATRQLLPSTCDAIDRLLTASQSVGSDAIREIELSENADASERAVFLDGDPRLDAAAL